jgi:class 3 adenylate cyclase
VTVSGQDDARIRVSDAERDAVVLALRGHYETGRLTLDEFNDRVGEAYSARTEADLDHVLRELPKKTAEAPEPQRPGWTNGRRLSGAVTHYATLNGLLIAIWAASGAGYFWPIWVLIPTAFVLLRRVAGTDDDRHLNRSRQRHRHRHHHTVEASPPAQRPAPETPLGRVVMSVLFVDIVSSTEQAAALGDAAWHAVVSRYERGVQAALRQFAGDTLFTKGDEVVAGFALPASAVECALRIRDEARAAGLEVRAGVHAGEVDRVGSQANGIAMHIGRRVCESAAPGQVLVSSTVHDLLAGSGIAFMGAGDHELKGLSGSWRLYEPSS